MASTHDGAWHAPGRVKIYRDFPRCGLYPTFATRAERLEVVNAPTAKPDFSRVYRDFSARLRHKSNRILDLAGARAKGCINSAELRGFMEEGHTLRLRLGAPVLEPCFPR
jgi:hypothetical protein